MRRKRASHGQNKTREEQNRKGGTGSKSKNAGSISASKVLDGRGGAVWGEATSPIHHLGEGRTVTAIKHLLEIRRRRKNNGKKREGGGNVASHTRRDSAQP